MKTNLPGNRGLSDANKTALVRSYQSAITFEADQPTILFPREAAETILQASEHRKKDWKSTSRWCPMADYTGLVSEMAAQHYLQVAPDAFLQGFLEGLNGDRGHDLVVNVLKIDVKGSRSPSARYKFSKTNKNTNLADAFLFAFVEEIGSESWVHLLGYCLRYETKNYLRDDGKRLFLRVESLRRDGILKPVSLLKAAQKESESTNE